MKNKWLNRVRLGVAAVGAMDFATGLALVFAPVVTLELMRVPVPGAEALVYLRWVGAFVGAVGASYLLAVRDGGLQLETRLVAVLKFTLVFRLVAGCYSAAAIWNGWLGGMWASVPATDLGLVALQLWVLSRKEWRQ